MTEGRHGAKETIPMLKISAGKGTRGVILTALLSLSIAGFFAGTGNAAGIRIVSIDTRRVFEAHPAFKEAMEKFQAQIQEMQKKIEEADEESKGEMQQMMQQQLQQLGMELQEEAFNRMRVDVQKIAKEKKYGYVIDSNMLISGGSDITEEILASFEKMAKKEPAPEQKTDK